VLFSLVLTHEPNAPNAPNVPKMSKPLNPSPLPKKKAWSRSVLGSPKRPKRGPTRNRFALQQQAGVCLAALALALVLALDLALASIPARSSSYLSSPKFTCNQQPASSIQQSATCHLHLSPPRPLAQQLPSNPLAYYIFTVPQPRHKRLSLPFRSIPLSLSLSLPPFLHPSQLCSFLSHFF
jgi:hypothetical protein